MIQWQQNFGGSKDDFIYNFIEDHEGNFVIICETYSFDFDAAENHSEYGARDFFILKVSAQGQKIWSHCYGGGSDEYARGIVESNGNEYVVVGESYSNDGQ
jgi:hypothetical protein